MSNPHLWIIGVPDHFGDFTDFAEINGRRYKLRSNINSDWDGHSTLWYDDGSRWQLVTLFPVGFTSEKARAYAEKDPAKIWQGEITGSWTPADKEALGIDSEKECDALMDKWRRA